jgi:hypothetical protein
MKSPYLRVKIKSLAAESLIIKREMLKFRTTNPVYERLHQHRVVDVRKEARATIVAYGFLNGLAYHEIESASYEEPDWTRVSAMVAKYGTEGTIAERATALKEWRQTKRDNRGMYRPVIVQTITEEELLAGLDDIINVH